VKATRDKEVNDDNYKDFILMCWKVEKGSSNPRDQSNFLLPEVTDNMKITVQSNQAKQENESILVFFFSFSEQHKKEKIVETGEYSHFFKSCFPTVLLFEYNSCYK